MIKIANLLREGKQDVINYVEFEMKRNFATSPKGRLLAKIRKDIDTFQSDEELHTYLNTNFSDRSKSWANRLVFADLLNVLEGKKS